MGLCFCSTQPAQKRGTEKNKDPQRVKNIQELKLKQKSDKKK